MLNFFRVLASIEYRDRLRKKRLKKEPQGFHLSDDGVYNCPICYTEISGKTTWYDSCGFKCLDCQRALDKKVILKYLFRNNDSWLDTGDLKSRYNLHYQTIQKLIREGKLKPRNIRNKQGNIHHQIFIKRENKNLSEETGVNTTTPTVKLP